MELALPVPVVGSGSALPPLGSIKEVLVTVTDPFFLGFAFEYLGMGIIMMLGIQYFVGVKRPKPDTSNGETSPISRPTRLGHVLVFFSLLFNLVQTIMDMVRGWDMFALGFLDIVSFATPDYMWFASPFLGLFPALITQAFLLRRITLFLSSLSSLWPMLDRPAVKMSFIIIMTGGMIISFLAGCIGSYWIWKSGPLWEFFENRNNISYIADLVWLATSSAVDLVLSMVLSLELWWARRKLAAKGGMMAKVTWQLLLITFHGGIAVTALQLTALFLFQFQSKNAVAFCYLPILFLPKIYTLTLILSLTLPQNHQPGHTPSHVYSLPNLNSNHEATSGNTSGNRLENLNRSPYTSNLYHRRSPIPTLPPLQLQVDGVKKDDRKSAKSGLSSVVAKSWRLSQDWLSWSLISNDDTSRREREDKERKRGSTQSRWKIADQEDQLPLPPGFNDQRRPSEPNSLAPLLPLGPRSSLSLNSYPTMSTYSYGQPDQLHLPHHYPTTPMPLPYSPALSTPPRSITVSRTHSFSTGSTLPRRSSVSTAPLATPTAETGFRFDTTNPFGSVPRQRALTPIRAGSESEEGHIPQRSGPYSTKEEVEEGRPAMRSRLMSFEDMLDGPRPGRGDPS